ncbi:metallophosphoesterase [Flavobacterium bomense]|uniref:Metallophosphoesterase n=1 Tax=Flavobacterium bomense TaxID=2497483 RepID=A0A3S0NXG3_9FLAO|nr:metallophosphoesterase [Flavobacterium bomense]RTZ01757.1 metallophosphoesterase [Flavobacterium bomense]
MSRIIIYLSFLLCLYSTVSKGQAPPEELKIAFLADVHFQDIYGTLQDSDYKGITNPKNGKHTLLRTMESQLHSTRIFNENYFAFFAVLDDIVQRGIKIVALPGDYSDDGQPLHIRGLRQILTDYTKKYGIQFFITTGNHDPAGPFAQESGKNDFLGNQGKRQPIFSKKGLYKPNSNDENTVVITQDIAKMGYLGITTELKDFGFSPKESDLFWTTPFCNYSLDNYTYTKATEASSLTNRTYSVTPGYSVPDVSYVVEPVPGLWLLAIDGNLYIPKKEAAENSKDSKEYSDAGLGYNKVLSHKKHLIKWIEKINVEAKKRGKTLIAFSHFPMVEFNDDASTEIEKLMGKGKWQLDRVPKEEVAETFADAGLRIHFGGHMHINDTGVRKTKKGNTLVNIQTPSLAAYIPAYKLLTVKENEIMEIETIPITEVPRFNELFDLYKIEYEFLKSQNTADLWNKDILETKNYLDFTDFHLKELVRLRFLPDDWPEEFKNFILEVSAEELLLLANIESTADYNTIINRKSNFKEAWKKAENKLKQQLKENQFNQSDFKWSGLELITDFYRIRSADELAIAEIGKERIKQYQFIIASYLDHQKGRKLNPENQTAKNTILFLTILNKFLNGAPSDHFFVDLKSGVIQK